MKKINKDILNDILWDSLENKEEILKNFENDVSRTAYAVNVHMPDTVTGELNGYSKNKGEIIRMLVDNIELNYFLELVDSVWDTLKEYNCEIYDMSE